ncbi:hypothetical protein H2248_007780 [Termitomyces sp. 'cryptogamus']|nr:hypothetical protein H2248_007780 [Termitomyces sp. 'cryptogamus']
MQGGRNLRSKDYKERFHDATGNWKYMGHPRLLIRALPMRQAEVMRKIRRVIEERLALKSLHGLPCPENQKGHNDGCAKFFGSCFKEYVIVRHRCFLTRNLHESCRGQLET